MEEQPKQPDNELAVGLLRWMLYSVLMCACLCATVPLVGTWRVLLLSPLLGHFSAQLNALKNK